MFFKKWKFSLKNQKLSSNCSWFNLVIDENMSVFTKNYIRLIEYKNCNKQTADVLQFCGVPQKKRKNDN